MAEEMKDKKAGKVTAAEAEIHAQVAEQGDRTSEDGRKTGITKSEQPLTETEVPEAAELSRGYYKWTDNDGNFHKVPIDGTTAIREPAHEQHELTVEDRDRLYEAVALKTPRRAEAGVAPTDIQKMEVHNDEVNVEVTKSGTPVEPIQADTGEIKDSHPELHDQGQPVKATAGGTKGTVSESVDANARDNR